MRIHDGAYGTLLQRHLNGDETVDDLCLREPRLVTEVHRAYLEAGADMIQTNAFLAHLRDVRSHRRRDLQLAAVDCARDAVAAAGRDDAAIVATLGPAGKEARDFWYDLELLLEAGVTTVRCETVTSRAIAAAFLEAWSEVGAGMGDVDVLLGCSISPTTNEPFPSWLADLASTVPDQIRLGLNCCDGPDGLRSALELLVEHRPDRSVWVDPSAGLPPYMEAKNWGSAMAALIDGLPLAAAGGCCGTEPGYVSLLRETAAS